MPQGNRDCTQNSFCGARFLQGVVIGKKESPLASPSDDVARIENQLPEKEEGLELELAEALGWKSSNGSLPHVLGWGCTSGLLNSCGAKSMKGLSRQYF